MSLPLLASDAVGILGISPAFVQDGVPTPLGMFTSEFLGTAILILLGAGVVAGQLLPRTKNHAGGWLMIAFGWGLGVYAGVYAAYLTGGHLNPAVTLGLAVSGQDLTTGVPATFVNIVIYIAGQMVGAFVGAVLCWLAYKQHFDQDEEPALKLGVFSTGPEIRSYGWNLVTEVLATFVLIAFVLYSGMTPAELGPLPVALVVVAIGVSLGGPTGYAINPARDLGPRIAHAVLPIRGKGGSDWSYAWVPVLGPILGAMLAALVVPLLVAL
ncbi:MIP/aquaporin family protein [Rothia santali]